jgi:hypothetical protein
MAYQLGWHKHHRQWHLFKITHQATQRHQLHYFQQHHYSQQVHVECEMTKEGLGQWFEELDKNIDEKRYQIYKKMCEALKREPDNKEEFKKWFYKERTPQQILEDEEAIAYYIREGRYAKSKRK